MFKSIVFTALTLSIAVLAHAADDPAAPTFTLSPMRIADLKATSFLYKAVHGTYQEAGPAAADVIKNVHAKNITVAGGLVFVFKDPTPDPTQPVSMEIGVPVAPGTKAPDGYAVGELESLHSATAVFTGNISDLGPAIVKLLAAVKQSGNTAAGPVRERFLYWEDETSDNNVVLIEIPLQSL